MGGGWLFRKLKKRTPQELVRKSNATPKRYRANSSLSKDILSLNC